MGSLTPWLTGAGSRRLEGTNISHENAEGMAYVGVRVEPPVRLGSAVEDLLSQVGLHVWLLKLVVKLSIAIDASLARVCESQPLTLLRQGSVLLVVVVVSVAKM